MYIVRARHCCDVRTWLGLFRNTINPRSVRADILSLSLRYIPRSFALFHSRFVHVQSIYRRPNKPGTSYVPSVHIGGCLSHSASVRSLRDHG